MKNQMLFTFMEIAFTLVSFVCATLLKTERLEDILKEADLKKSSDVEQCKKAIEDGYLHTSSFEADAVFNKERYCAEDSTFKNENLCDYYKGLYEISKEFQFKKEEFLINQANSEDIENK